MARMQGKTTSKDDEYSAGVDVSKADLDLRVSGARRGLRFGNDAAGIAALVAHLGAPHRVVLEPTGRYHLALWRALEAAGHGVAPINPFAARRLAEGMGHLAKSDAVDAFVLSEIALRLSPEPRPAPDDFTLGIKELHSARRAAIKRRAMARTEASGSANPRVLRLLADQVALLSAQIDELTMALRTRIKARAPTGRTLDILTSIRGLGEAAAITLFVRLPELGRASRSQIAALAGIAPMTRESGQSKARATTRGADAATCAPPCT